VTARDDYPIHAGIADRWTDAGRECDRMLNEIDRLRATNEAWMNGVADAVEPLGYDREAACGPADLLPGLKQLLPAVWVSPNDGSGTP
jgi:sporulation-control protein spo0M